VSDDVTRAALRLFADEVSFPFVVARGWPVLARVDCTVRGEYLGHRDVAA
jgi:hypothetical protein